MGPLDFVAESDQPRLVALLHQRMSGDLDHTDYVFRGHRKDGTIIDIECHGSAMDLDDRVRICLGETGEGNQILPRGPETVSFPTSPPTAWAKLPPISAAPAGKHQLPSSARLVIGT